MNLVALSKRGEIVNRGLLIATFGVLLILLSFNIATATHKNAEYTYMIGTGFLEEFGDVISKAPNGDTIEFIGEGNFSTSNKKANGRGTFIHRNSEGDVIGTGKWAATRLISFQPYGSGVPQGLPENFEGGRALVKVTLDPDGVGESFDATLKITCVIGNKIPPKAEEGIRLAVRGIPINFNEEVSGGTLFIRTA